jgi:hypothetical protein
MDDRVSPQSDFQTWHTILTSCLEEQSGYVQFLPDFISLADQIIANGTLQEPLAANTPFFLSTVAKSVMIRVLNLRTAFESDFRAIQQCLASISRLTLWAAAHDKFAVASSFLPVFEKTSSLFTRAPHQHRTFIATFLEAKVLSVLIQRILSGNSQLDHFSILAQILSKVKESAASKSLDADSVSPALTIFVTFLSEIPDAARDFDWVKLSRTIDLFVTCFPNSTFLRPIFDFGSKLIGTDVLQKRLIGGQILNRGVKFFPGVFRQWKTTCPNLLSNLIDKDIHADLLAAVGDLLDAELAGEKLAVFWERAQHAHSSLRGPMLAIVARVLGRIDAPSAQAFCDRVFETPNCSPELLGFLGSAAVLFAERPSRQSMAFGIVDRLIDCGCQSADAQSVVAALSPLANYKTSLALRTHIISKCEERLVTVDGQNFAAVILTAFAQACSDFIGDFSAGFVERIARLIPHENANRPLLFRLLSVSVIRSRVMPPGDVFLELQRPVADDAFWLFMRDVLEKLVGDALPRAASLAFSDNILPSYDLTNATHSFVQVLRLLVLIENIPTLIQPKLVPIGYERRMIPTDFVVLKFPLVYTEFLINVCARANSDAIATEAQTVFLGFLLKATKISGAEILGILQRLIEQHFTDGPKAKARGFNLMISYIEKAEERLELEGYGSIRHKPSKMSRLAGVFHLTIMDGNRKFCIVVKKTLAVADLSEKLAPVIGLRPSEFKLMLSNRVLQYWALHQNQIRDQDTIKVELVGAPVRQPTHTFSLEGLSSHVFQEIKNATDHLYMKLCRRFLNVLPTDPMIVALVSKPSEFLDSLKGEKNEYILGYELHVLSSQLTNPEIVDGLKRNNGFDFLLQLFTAHTTAFKGIGEVLDILQRHFGTECQQASAVILPHVMALFPVLKRDKVIACKLMAQFVNKAPMRIREANIRLMLADEAAFQRFIEAFDDESFQFFNPFLSNSDERIRITKICLRHIGDAHPAHYYFIGLLSANISVIRDLNLLRQVLARCLELIPDAKGRSQIPLSTIISKIVDLRVELAGSSPDATLLFLKLALATDEKDIRSKFLSVVERALTKTRDERVLEYLRSVLDVDTDRWAYAPTTGERSSTGCLGLRNLGSTCYMNAVLQQLFHTLPFRYLVVTTPTVDESQKQLQALFSRLLISQRRFADTQPFCAVWKGWHQKIVDPREQQDAFEFLQLFFRSTSRFQFHVSRTIETHHFGGYRNIYVRNHRAIFHTSIRN